MPIDLLGCIVLFAGLPILKLILLDVGLINFDEGSVPFLLVDSVDDHEDVEAELVVYPLLLLQLGLQLHVLPLHGLVYGLYLLYLLPQLEYFLLLLLELVVKFEQL